MERVGEGGSDGGLAVACCCCCCWANACLSDCGRDIAPVLIVRSVRPSGRACTSLANSTRSGEMCASGRYDGVGTAS